MSFKLNFPSLDANIQVHMSIIQIFEDSLFKTKNLLILSNFLNPERFLMKFAMDTQLRIREKQILPISEQYGNRGQCKMCRQILQFDLIVENVFKYYSVSLRHFFLQDREFALKIKTLKCTNCLSVVTFVQFRPGQMRPTKAVAR